INRVLRLLEILHRCPEIKPSKLAALQRILLSDFCDMIREVYKHICTTVGINGSEEVSMVFAILWVSHKDNAPSLNYYLLLCL
ncbi:lin-7-like proteins, partial [Schistosoma mansoni]|uniref:lin-7-like proteins n=1 Tax=Schistosoma mansoni TaxID=6183 RepID=UPI00022C82A2